MAGVAEQTLRFALDAHCQGELSACANVRLNEAVINRSEREIDQMALDLLAMEQPMAVDLRFVLAAIKINSDLERVGDQSMTIALLAEELASSQPCDFPVDIPRMAELSMTMVRKALQALAERDAELATSVLAMDDAVDEMNRRAKSVLLECMAKDSSGSIRRQPAVHFPQPGADRRSRHQYGRRCHLLGARSGCSSRPRCARAVGIARSLGVVRRVFPG
jgi:phosphate transport system protein